ncbi:MAG: GNAT family N-acetyltransferase [Minwuia sp.]|uniref:GNAT family N-acetyltransferase n=1 Tax=Minwuia sp. TaxID=2493630 RepID=UPI003A8B4EDD
MTLTAHAGAISIQTDDPRAPGSTRLLEAHLAHSWDETPETSNHTFDAEALAAADVTFWTARDGNEVVGCGALKRLDAESAELKSMHTAEAHRGRGVARLVMEHALDHARAQGFCRILLETGTMAGYAAARALYLGRGFTECGPFGDYSLDPNSVFMCLELDR